ncbi:WecB/TagA/CpsF family glycosyltransferase [Novosphingobium colocasiae]|uniref:UDP-N-acetyl-D-mannosaminuronic acid transferase n=1 Tax=Novosphingobium colocasiae TaxID=1256513 RepID=A0A918PM91_9SPHN|nr:WecB/TagA/CpsF family glycosyltransferase [Novosphingobium colocasiae]GGZ15944.1 UDP-N-acetyl-D-mannosaminuronic acid transferase [Novosphingobium colocasiae]
MYGKLATYDVLGVPITVTTITQAAQTIEAWAQDDVGRFVCIRDVPSLMAINGDSAIRDLHFEAAMITPDSSYIALIGQLRGLPVEQTSGPDLIDLVAQRSIENGMSHYFYGGREGVAQELAEIFIRRYPGFRVAGAECPPFRELTGAEDEAVIERIKSSGADVVWVGISSPKQDVWMRDHYKHLPQTLIGVGAAFDFHTGTVKRAPLWMREARLEWAYRLAREPRRLWRRYLIQAPKFVFMVARSALWRRLAMAPKPGDSCK